MTSQEVLGGAGDGGGAWGNASNGARLVVLRNNHFRDTGVSGNPGPLWNGSSGGYRRANRVDIAHPNLNGIRYRNRIGKGFGIGYGKDVIVKGNITG